MSIARIQAVQNKTTSSATNATTITSSQSGSLIVVMLGYATAAAPIVSIMDNKGNTYVAASGAAGNGFGATVDTWYSQNSLAGVTTITVTLTSSASFIYSNVIEYSGIKVSATLDTAGVNINSSGGPMGPSLVSSQSGSVGVTYLFPITVNMTGVQSPWASVAIDAFGTEITDYINCPATTIQAIGVPTGAQDSLATGAVFFEASASSPALPTTSFLVF